MLGVNESRSMAGSDLPKALVDDAELEGVVDFVFVVVDDELRRLQVERTASAGQVSAGGTERRARKTSSPWGRGPD